MRDIRHLDELRIIADQRPAEKDYWLDTLAGEPEKFGFPCDYKKERSRKPIVGISQELFSKEISASLLKLSTGSDVRLHIALIAAVTLLLNRYTGERDIIIGTPILNPGIGQDAGFTNTVIALRNQIKEEQSFKGLLLAVRSTCREALENQGYPVEILIAELGLSVSEGDFPLFDVAVLLENIHKKEHIDQVAPKMIFSFCKIGEDIACRLEYDSLLYDRSSAGRIIGHLKRLLQVVLADVDIKIAAVDILLEEEKRQLLYDFNDTMAPYPGEKTIHELFAEQAARAPDRIAVIGYDANHKVSEREELSLEAISMPTALTYKELNEKAELFTRVLYTKGAGSGTIVGLLAERSIEMILGILAILKAGGAYLPIDPQYPQTRKEYMLKDSNTPLLLTTRSMTEEVEKLISSGVNELKSLRVEKVVIEETGSRVGAWRAVPETDPTLNSSSRRMAYIIYTSGSTGNPKGVMVEHRSVVNILTDLQKKYPLNEPDTYLFKTSYVFDVSVAELFGWFPAGGKLAILEKGAEKEPEKIIAAIEYFAVTHVNFVPSMFNVFVEELNDRNIGKLASLKNIFLAGEVLLPELVNKFRKFDTRIKLENIYGPTEGTVYTSNYSLTNYEGSGSIPIGKPMQNIKLYILSRDERLQPIGVPGELCIAGTDLARGYLNNPELTAEKFINLASQPTGSDVGARQWPKSGGPGLFSTYNFQLSNFQLIYKTGDLCRWLPDGNLEFCGRIDCQVKIRGFRIEPEEVENQLLIHEKVKEAVVTVNEVSREKCLCAYIVGDIEGVTNLRQHLAERLPDYMIPSYFTFLDKMPLTPNGKIDQKALPELEPRAAMAYVAPRDDVEQRMAKIWSGVLGIEEEKIGIDDNFFELGGHSLRATTIISKIHKIFNIKVPLKALFNTLTIRLLAGHIKSSQEEKYAAIASIEKKEYYVLSSAQNRLYLLQQMTPGSTGYHIPVVLLLEGDLHLGKLRNTFMKLIGRHESLRTSFSVIYEQPVQKIHNPEDIEFKIEYLGEIHQTREEVDQAREGLINRFIRPFDLFEAPLLRAGLVPLEKRKHILMLDMHHIITDGMSMALMTKEFIALYSGEVLPPLSKQYRDFSKWQNEKKQSGAAVAQKMYWLAEFSGEIPVLTLPTDFPRPPIQDFSGRSIAFEFGRGVTDKLKSMALDEDVTLYMVLLALFNIFLSKLSGQEEIIVGSPTAGRIHYDLSGLIGMFVNTLALRNYPAGEKTFREFLQEVKNRAIKAQENQEYQFEDLVEEVGVNRDLSRNPLFDVMFVFQNVPGEELGNSELKISQHKHESRIAKFDMTLAVMEHGEGLSLVLEYCSNLFREESIRRFITYFRCITEFVIKTSGVNIRDIEMVPEEEKEKLLHKFNDTKVDYPRDKTIHGLFEEQVDKAPGCVALVGIKGQSTEFTTLTYRELHEKSLRVAVMLKRKGIAFGDIIGLMVDRSIEMIIGMLAILKAGGAYLPLDPEYPEERNRYILQDSDSLLLLTQTGYMEKELGKEKLDLGDEANYKKEAIALPEKASNSGNFAYVIYTSGSTGIPKGVLVEHRNVNNLVSGLYERIYKQYYPGLRVCLVAPYVFDASVQQVFAALLLGHILHVVPENTRVDGTALLEYFGKYDIHIADGTPTHILMMVESITAGLTAKEVNSLRSVKHFIIGGEALPKKTVERFFVCFGENCPKITNVYGPAECCVDSISFEISKENLSAYNEIPVGKPMPNEQVYILDKNLSLQPIGVVGELCIGGDGVSMGYLNRPGLTAEKFVRNPFTHPPAHMMLYKTGDLARWLANGNIEFIGRMDSQVKIRGFRIEIGEIESRLLDHEAVKGAVVIDRDRENGEKYLCAYIVEAQNHASRSDGSDVGARRAAPPMPAGRGGLSFSDLKQYLSRTLPDYMIPAFFVRLESIPLSPNGKVDRNALPDPGSAALHPEENFVAPRNQLEESISRIWQEVLEMPRVGINDNFFDIGGNSLNVIRVGAKMKQDLGVSIPLVTMFRYTTISGLVAHLSSEDRDEPIIRETVDREGRVDEGKKRRLQKIKRRRSEIDG